MSLPYLKNQSIILSISRPNFFIKPPYKKLIEKNIYTRENKKLKNYKRSMSSSLDPHQSYFLHINIGAPITIQDALKHVNAQEWQTTTNDELKCLKKNKTWKLITLPPNRTSRSSK
jgi:hypothetical protein